MIQGDIYYASKEEGLGPGDSWVPADQHPGLTFTDMAVALVHSCGLLPNNSVLCW